MEPGSYIPTPVWIDDGFTRLGDEDLQKIVAGHMLYDIYPDGTKINGIVPKKEDFASFFQSDGVFKKNNKIGRVSTFFSKFQIKNDAVYVDNILVRSKSGGFAALLFSDKIGRIHILMTKSLSECFAIGRNPSLVGLEEIRKLPDLGERS